MTPRQPHSTRRQTPAVQTPRLRLKPKALPTGHVDGAWWPNSTDLPDELPDLLAVLSVRLGEISHVTFQVGEWAKTPTTMAIGDQSVRLAGYRRQPSNTIEVRSAGGTSIVLLVVPPGTDADHAHDTMMAAARPENTCTASRLLLAQRN